MQLKTIWVLFKNTAIEWQEDKVSLWAAGIAFYTIFSLAPLLIIGFLLLVSLIFSAVLAAIANFFGHLFPQWIQLGQMLNLIFSFGGTTLLFALLYKVLPDINIAWSNIWIGATTSALLFTIGKFLIGFYLGNSSIGSSYGSASSLVIVLI